MSSTRRLFLMGSVVLATAALSLGSAMAQYPDAPIKFIIPFGPGGGADIAGRALASELEKLLGQPVIVENVAGGGGSVGLTGLFNAPADGYTIGMGTGSNTTVAPHVAEVAYDALGFSYIANFYAQPYMIQTNPSVPANNLTELAEWAKANPGALVNSTTGGYGVQDIGMALFSEAVGGIEYRTLPNSSAAESTLRILSGDANVTVGTTFNLQHIEAGTIKAIGDLSDVSSPAVDALGLQKSEDTLGFVLINRAVILAPPALPEDIRARLEKAVADAAQSPALIAQLEQLGFPIVYKSGAEALQETTQTNAAYGKIVADLMAKAGK